MPRRTAARSPAGFGTLYRLRFAFVEAAFKVAPELRRSIEAIDRARIVWADGTFIALGLRHRRTIEKVARRFNLDSCPWAIEALRCWPGHWNAKEPAAEPEEAAPSPEPFYLCFDGLGPEDDLRAWKRDLSWAFKRRLEVYLRGEESYGVRGALERMPLRLSRKAPGPQTFEDLARRIVLRLTWKAAFGFDATRSSAEEEYRTRHAAAVRLADTIGIATVGRRRHATN